jgi:hypothetical protein
MNRGDRIEFSAALPVAMQPEVDAFFYFHPRQAELRDDICRAVLNVGMPAIAKKDGRFSIEIPSVGAQCIFACDSAFVPLRAIGVILYSRPIVDTLSINHLAINPVYAYGGEYSDLRAASRLVDRVLAVARVVKGINKVQLPYRENCFLRIMRRSRP